GCGNARGGAAGGAGDGGDDGAADLASDPSDGGTSGGDGGGSKGDAGVLPPAARGATLPYWKYEAESAATNGVVIGPSRAFGDLAAEASGRRAVRLEAAGQHVQFTLDHPTNSIVV